MRSAPAEEDSRAAGFDPTGFTAGAVALSSVRGAPEGTDEPLGDGAPSPDPFALGDAASAPGVGFEAVAAPPDTPFVSVGIDAASPGFREEEGGTVPADPSPDGRTAGSVAFSGLPFAFFNSGVGDETDPVGVAAGAFAEPLIGLVFGGVSEPLRAAGDGTAFDAPGVAPGVVG